VVVAAVNRVGQEGNSSFWGGSFISNGFGELVAKADNEERLIVGEVDLGHSRFTRESWRFMASRRPDQYTLLTKNVK
jgi:N-carbamoylputrescine amidase